MNRTQPEAHTLTAAYVCDALDPAERSAFEEHLRACAACRQEVAELREAAAKLGAAVAVTPPVRLKAAVDARVEITRQLAPRGAPSTASSGRFGGRRRRSGGRARAGWIVAAALAGVATGQAVHGLQQQHRLNSVSQQADAMAQLLTAPDVRSITGTVRTGGSALVVASRSRGEAAVALAGLAAPPTGKAYQLWLIGSSGARSAGMVALAGGASGPIVARGLDGAETIGLTVEPAGGSAQPTTTPILLLQMS